MEWATSPAGGKMPLDPTPLEREPRPLDVVLHVSSRRTIVVSRATINNGDVAKWLARDDCELRSSHWDTCGGAAQHRAGFVREGQERMSL